MTKKNAGGLHLPAFFQLGVADGSFFLIRRIVSGNSWMAKQLPGHPVPSPSTPFSSGATRLADEKDVFCVILRNANSSCSGMPYGISRHRPLCEHLPGKDFRFPQRGVHTVFEPGINFLINSQFLDHPLPAIQSICQRTFTFVFSILPWPDLSRGVMRKNGGPQECVSRVGSRQPNLPVFSIDKPQGALYSLVVIEQQPGRRLFRVIAVGRGRMCSTRVVPFRQAG